MADFAIVLPVCSGICGMGNAQRQGNRFTMSLKSVLAVLFAFGVAVSSANVTLAAGTEKPAAEASEDAALTPEEKAEKEARKACKIEVCKAFHSKSATGQIACHVIKSWRKERLTKLISKLKVTWPYGGVHCSTDLSVDRADLVKAMTEPKAEIAFQKHTVTCSIADEKKGDKQFKFELTPTIQFENGKATKAHANWGKIEAPTLVKSAMWTATAADNTVNLLSGTIVEEANNFITKRCDEVKDAWSGQP
jgi:hypothetical protein